MAVKRRKEDESQEYIDKLTFTESIRMDGIRIQVRCGSDVNFMIVESRSAPVTRGDHAIVFTA